MLVIRDPRGPTLFVILLSLSSCVSLLVSRGNPQLADERDREECTQFHLLRGECRARYRDFSPNCWPLPPAPFSRLNENLAQAYPGEPCTEVRQLRR